MTKAVKAIQKNLNRFAKMASKKVTQNLDLDPIFYSLSKGVVRKVLQDALANVENAPPVSDKLIRNYQNRFKKAIKNIKVKSFTVQWVNEVGDTYSPGILIFRNEPGPKGSRKVLNRIVTQALQVRGRERKSATAAVNRAIAQSRAMLL